MENSQLNRRDFQRLTAAAVGGLLAGARRAVVGLRRR